MLDYVIIFFILALIAGLLGFGGMQFAFSNIAQILFGLFIILFIISLIMKLMRGKTPPSI